MIKYKIVTFMNINAWLVSKTTESCEIDMVTTSEYTVKTIATLESDENATVEVI